MQYNTIKNALTAVNTIDGNVALTIDQVTALINVSEVTVKTLTANSGTGNYDKLVIDCDFGVRLHSCEMRYYFDSTVNSSAVVSGISFQYKNEDFQDYTSLPVYTNQNYYNTNVSGTLFAPRYIRFTHDLEHTEGFLTTLSGYVEGNLLGLELYNDDTYVNFGADGTVEGDNISVAIGGDVDIRSVAIYNSGPNKSNAYISLDPTYTDLDKAIGVSVTNNGPWVYPTDEELSVVIADEDASYGVYNNTELRDSVIRITGYFDAYLGFVPNDSGNYTTKVFSSDSSVWNSIIVDRALPLEGALKVDLDDGAETIEVRSSNYKPKPYHIFRECITYYDGMYRLRYTDKFVETDQIKTTSGNIASATFSSASIDAWKNYFLVIDKWTEMCGGFAYVDIEPLSYNHYEWWIFNIDINGTSKSKQLVGVAADPLSFDWKYLKFDYTGGMWVYFYAVAYSSSDFVDETGYYLCYFDSDLTEKFKYFSTSDFVGNMDVAYTTKNLWYTMPESNQIQQLSFDGTVLYNYFENTEDLGGLCVLYDNSVWYANGRNLYNLKETGVADDTKTLTDVADNKFIYIVADGDGAEALWVLENFYVSRLLLYGERKGEKNFSVYVEHAIRLYPVASGVWVWCADIDNPGDSYMRYISKDNKRIDKEYKLTYNSMPGVFEHVYDDQLYASKMPLSIDQEWLNLDWTKVNTESFILSEDNYQQVKVTLRKQTYYQLYGDAVDISDDFHTDDDFNQEDGSPNYMIWGEYSGDGRVYVEDNQLVLKNDIGGENNAYISTKNKYVLSGNFDVQFDYIIGDGTATGILEYVYLDAVATDEGVSGEYIRSYIRICSSSYSYIYRCVNTSCSYVSLGIGYDGYTGKLRLKKSGTNVYGYVWDPQTSSWIGSYSSGAAALGTYFYLQIQASRNGSDIYIDNFTVTEGTAYYYTGTPKVKGIYTRKDIQLEDIYPNTSKNIYLKSQVLSTMDVEGHYDTSMKVRWRTPVE